MPAGRKALAQAQTPPSGRDHFGSHPPRLLPALWAHRWFTFTVVGRPNTWLGCWGLAFVELDASLTLAGVDMFRKSKSKVGEVIETNDGAAYHQRDASARSRARRRRSELSSSARD